MLRVIVQSSINGDVEYVRFNNDDLDEDAEFFTIPGCTIDQDFNIDCPALEKSPFPFNYNLLRK